MLNHLIQNGIAHIHTMLADGRENFIKHPTLKSFCRWQFAVNDQPVNIAFHDKGDFNDLLSSIPILIHLPNDPLAFRYGASAMAFHCGVGIHIPQRFRHIACTEECLACLL